MDGDGDRDAAVPPLHGEMDLRSVGDSFCSGTLFAAAVL
jgi:hypothetical protein